MGTNDFSSIGFPLGSVDSLSELLQNIVKSEKNLEVFKVEEGAYIEYNDPSGAVIWIQLDKENNVIGCHPHFNGDSIRKIRIEQIIQKKDDTVLDGAFYGWSVLNDKDPGEFPLIFNVPNIKTYKKLSLPVISNIQLIAFARELHFFKDEIEFHESWKELAPVSFIPTGLIDSNGDHQTANNISMFAGKIIEINEKLNEFTKNKFLSVKVETLGGVIDLVADKRLIEQEPILGGVVLAGCYISGIIK